MNPLITLGLAVVVLIVFVMFRSRRDRRSDLGQVSSQWIMEHRSGSGQDSSR